MKTSSSNKKVRELINMVKDGTLIPRPEFQRRLVWTREDKNFFLDSILKGFPFPEIYFADGEVDTATGQGTQLLVDGLQRISTITQYFNADAELTLISVPSYSELTQEQKVAFLQYDVSVRDLGAIPRDVIIEVFKRINATKYSLSDIEVNNAVYVGALKRYAEQLAERDFFKIHRVFDPRDYKRMGDLRYALLIVATMLEGYFNRDDAFERILDRYNDEFPKEREVTDRLDRVFDFIQAMQLASESRVWRKADLFTLIVELDRCLQAPQPPLINPAMAGTNLDNFYGRVDGGSLDPSKPEGVYYKATVQANNDRSNRLRRGAVIEGVLTGLPDDEIMKNLRAGALL